MLLLLLVISVLVLTAIFKYRQIYSFFETYRLAKLIQGPPLCPLIGSFQFFRLNPVQAYALGQQYSKCYARGFRLWVVGKLIYVSYTADVVEEIITNPKNIQKSFTYDFVKKFLGDGLLISSDQKWFHRRKILTPAFHFTTLRKFVPSMKHQTKILIDVLMKEEHNNPNGTNLQEVISRFTLNTICETAMGITLTKATELDEYREHIHEYGTIHINRVMTPWLHSNIIYKLFGKEREEDIITSKVHKFTSEIIAIRRKMLKNNIINDDVFGKQRHAMIDTLLIAEDKGQINSTGIQEEVDTFVFEGYDTTMTAITFVLFMIANHFDVQERLFEEINGNHDIQNTDEPNVNKYNELKYLDCVIKESLRLYTPVPVIGRVLGDEMKIDDITLPIGTTVHIMINSLHRDPIHFPNPDRFDPDRFTLANSQHRHPYAYIPFSASYRNCIGQKYAMLELKIVTSEILKKFYLEPVTKIEEVIIKSDMVLRTAEPVKIRFISRS